MSTGADHQLQDMDIDEEPSAATGNITDQLSQFYSEIIEDKTDDVDDDNASVPDDASTNSQCSAPNSPPQPSSPSINQPKKRKKVC